VRNIRGTFFEARVGRTFPAIIVARDVTVYSAKGMIEFLPFKKTKPKKDYTLSFSLFNFNQREKKGSLKKD